MISIKTGDEQVANGTHKEKAGERGSDSLKTFFQTDKDEEAGVVPSRSMSRSPLTSRGMGWDMLDDGIDIGVCAIMLISRHLDVQGIVYSQKPSPGTPT